MYDAIVQTRITVAFSTPSTSLPLATIVRAGMPPSIGTRALRASSPTTAQAMPMPSAP